MFMKFAVSNAERRRQLLLNAVDVDLSYQSDESVVHANRNLSELTVEVSSVPVVACRRAARHAPVLFQFSFCLIVSYCDCLKEHYRLNNRYFGTLLN